MTKEMKVKKCSRDFNYWAILEGFIGDYLRYMNDGKEDGHIDNIFINHMANGNYDVTFECREDIAIQRDRDYHLEILGLDEDVAYPSPPEIEEKTIQFY
tara:strand:- start:752 stop:1048 length:297 start_codon:yes stop_codon:yes gene_type:complete